MKLPFKITIPKVNDNNINLYYLSCWIHESFFTEGVWILFYLKFFSYSQLGFMDALAIGIGLLLEIPTGAIADLIGKRKAVRFAYLMMVTALTFMAFGNNQWQLFLGNLIFFAGLSFYSGAADALAYESLAETNQLEKYAEVYTFSRSLKSIAFIIAVAIGSFAASFDPRYPFILWWFTFLIGTISTIWLREPQIKIKKSNNNYLQQNLNGIKQLFKPQLKHFAILIFVVLGLDYMYGWGFIKPAIFLKYGLDAKAMGIVLIAGGILSGITINYLPYFRKYISDYKAIFLLSLAVILSYFAFSLGIYWLSILFIILISVFASFAYGWINIVVNHYVDPEYRATALSTVAMILKLPFVIIAPIAGGIIDQGLIFPLLQTISAIMFVIISISVIIKMIGQKKGA